MDVCDCNDKVENCKIFKIQQLGGRGVTLFNCAKMGEIDRRPFNLWIKLDLMSCFSSICELWQFEVTVW